MNEKKNLRFNSLDCFILILILILEPSGLLGKNRKEKV